MDPGGKKAFHLNRRSQDAEQELGGFSPWERTQPTGSRPLMLATPVHVVVAGGRTQPHGPVLPELHLQSQCCL